MNFLHKLQIFLSELFLKNVCYFIKELSDIKESIYQLNLAVVELSQILDIFDHGEKKLERRINSSHKSLVLWILQL
jgi:hypothetical protein